ncbi:hypothetical protein ACHWQZ_G007023 [Mnemiopsis leidyi]
MELKVVAPLVGLPIAVVLFITLLKKRRVSLMMSKKKRELLEQADSWVDSAVVRFDPTKLITEEVFQDMADRLRKRVVSNNFKDPERNQYGIPVNFVNMVANHLADFYELNDLHCVLNKFNHFKTVIGDVNLHFIHMTGSNENSTPILLLHGWPSTVWEFHKSIPLLLKQGYTVVAPSLPGHGFTEPPTVTGVSPCVVACIFHKLMLKLGYNKYVVQGGDWGAIIGAVMTHIYPDHVIGLHNTMNHIHMGWRQVVQLVVGMFAPKLVYNTPQEQAFFNPLSGMEERMYKKFAFFHIQTVIPDTLGYGVVDSPVGVISWIGSPLVLNSAPNNNAAEWRRGLLNFGMDNVCATVLIYWAMRNSQAAMRLHYEFYWNDREYLENFTIPKVPVAISNFPNEIIHLTKFTSWRTFNNIKQFTYHDHGGHFAHLDNTEGVVGDLVSFIQMIK